MKTSDQRSRAWVFLVGTLALAACSGGGSATGGTAAPAATAGSVASAEAPASPEAPASAGGGSGGGGTGGGAIGGAVTDAGHLADLLGPGDFAAAGVSGAGTPTVNAPEPGSVYVVYAGKSGATGGIEFDAYAGDTAAGAADVFAPMSAPLLDFEGSGKAAFPDADGAQLRTDNPIDGGGEWAGIAIQKGRLVFLITIPGRTRRHRSSSRWRSSSSIAAPPSSSGPVTAKAAGRRAAGLPPPSAPRSSGT